MKDSHIARLNLNDCTSVRFSGETIDLGAVTYIHGRNGTGKSSICNIINVQLGEQFDVCLFDGFQSVVSIDNNLNAIALGNDNAELKERIDQLTEELTVIEKRISPNGEIGKNLERARVKQLRCSYEESETLTDIARELKRKENPRIVNISYNKTHLQQDLKNIPLRLLEDSYYSIVNKTAQMDALEPVRQFAFPDVEICSVFDDANELLQRSISPSVLIPEFENSIAKQNFASSGRDVHDRHVDTNCAFCGGELTNDRWELLDAFFNDASTSLKEEIKKCQRRIDRTREILEESRISEEDIFYLQFSDKAVTVRSRINELIATLCVELTELHQCLERRLGNEFVAQPPRKLQIALSELGSLSEAYRQIVVENNEFGKDFKNKQRDAKYDLLGHELARLSLHHKLSERIAKRKMATAELEEQQKLKNAALEEVSRLQRKISQLRGEMKDEYKAAQYINTLLRNLGVDTFRLERVESGEVGFYQVKNLHDNSLRNVTKLSTGEANFIAFMYFIYSLDAPRDSKLPRLIIFDDPMNSNDDVYQYAMISELHRLQEKIFDSSNASRDGLLVLTHNTHFYLNLFQLRTNFDKLYVYLLRSAQGVTHPFRILKKKDNIQTAYHSLWDDFYFAYKKSRPNLMWNTLRRIITTYLLFEGLNQPKVLREEAQMGGLLGRILQKSFNVNSHEILDFETESNRATVGEVLFFALTFFERRDNSQHFKVYWESCGGDVRIDVNDPDSVCQLHDIQTS